MDNIITKNGVCSKHADGIVYCITNEGSYSKIEDAIENINAIEKLTDGGKAPVLVDIRHTKGASKEARDYYAGDEATKFHSAQAIIVESKVSQLVANFFLGLNKTKFPVRLFTKASDAQTWLKSFL